MCWVAGPLRANLSHWLTPLGCQPRRGSQCHHNTSSVPTTRAPQDADADALVHVDDTGTSRTTRRSSLLTLNTSTLTTAGSARHMRARHPPGLTQASNRGGATPKPRREKGGHLSPPPMGASKAHMDAASKRCRWNCVWPPPRHTATASLAMLRPPWYVFSLNSLPLPGMGGENANPSLAKRHRTAGRMHRGVALQHRRGLAVRARASCNAGGGSRLTRA